MSTKLDRSYELVFPDDLKADAFSRDCQELGVKITRDKDKATGFPRVTVWTENFSEATLLFTKAKEIKERKPQKCYYCPNFVDPYSGPTEHYQLCGECAEQERQVTILDEPEDILISEIL